MRAGGAACVTYEQEFVAVRHESDLLTPLFHAPFASLSVRELGYLGALVICAMLSLAGSAPPWLAAAGLALAAVAFFRWRGETPEMYLYYAALAALESPWGAGRRRPGRSRGRSRRRGALDALLGRAADGRGANGRLVVGPGVEHALGSGAEDADAPRPARAGGGGRPAAAERILVASAPARGGPYEPAASAPVDLTLDLGASRAHAGVAVLVDGAELVRDTANGEGLLTVTMIPRAGASRIDVVDAATGGQIASHVVEFAAGREEDGGDGGGRGGVGG